MSSSSSNNSHGSYMDSNTSGGSRGSVGSDLVQTCVVQPKCTFRVMGGGADDSGAEFTIPYDFDFTSVYVDYARLAGVNPSTLHLMWANDFVSPASTPFKRGFKAKELVLAYERDFETPITVHGNYSGSSSKVVFFIHDMMDSHSHERHFKEKSFKLKVLFRKWGPKRGKFDAKSVQMYMKGNPLYDPIENNGSEGPTLGDLNVVDGTILYARIKSKEWNVNVSNMRCTSTSPTILL